MSNSKPVGVAYSDPALTSGTTIDGATIGGTTAGAGSFTTLAASGAATITGTFTSKGSSVIGDAASDTTGFYGTTPASQRTATIQAASLVSAASYISVSTNLSVWVTEVTNTLTGLGLWKGS